MNEVVLLWSEVNQAVEGIPKVSAGTQPTGRWVQRLYQANTIAFLYSKPFTHVFGRRYLR
jgi:hypothetical protein